jgi:glycosyltransferase involved in cell wall biosynthesis
LLIRLLTQHFYPDTVSTGNLLTELALGLKKCGFDIEVFTSQPLFDVKIKCKKFEEYKGIKIFRLTSTRFNKNSKFGKAFNYCNYFLKTSLKVLFSSNKQNCAYLIVSNPPFLPMIGVFLNYIKKIKFVHLLYDVLPESAVNTGYISEKSIIVKLWNFINKFIYKKSTHIIVLSEQMEKFVQDKLLSLGVKPELADKITIIDNWADANFLKPVNFEDNLFIKKHNFVNKFIINYSGNMGVSQRFDALMEAAIKLNDIDKDVIFLFVGDGVKKKQILKIKEEKSLSNIVMMGYQPKDELPHVLTASHLSVVHLEKEIEGLAMPSKLYTILACGTPVLAFCDEKSDLGKIVKDADCGYIVNHDNVDNIIQSIEQLKNNPEKQKLFSKNARCYFENNYTFERALQKYVEIFKNFDK